MLQAYPTKNGTGVSIYGDYGDLNSLYYTAHDIAETLSETNKKQKGQYMVLMNFAYEIRKAFSGQRLQKEMQFVNGKNKCIYYGFQLVWTDLLIFISVLRHNAGFFRTNRLHQANLYIL